MHFVAQRIPHPRSPAVPRPLNRSLVAVLTLVLAAAAATPAAAFQEGFIPVRLDPETGNIHLVVERLDEDFLYMNTLAAGLGLAAPTRLDRGQTGSARVVRFERRGPRVMLVQRNVNTIASSGDPGEIQSVEESFAPSILASLPVMSADGAALV